MSKVYKLGMEHKKFCYDKKTEPAVIIQSGDVVVFETEDANCGLIAKTRMCGPVSRISMKRQEAAIP